MLLTPFFSKINLNDSLNSNDQIIFLRDYLRNKIGDKIYFISLNEDLYSLSNQLKEVLLKDDNLEKEIFLNKSLTNFEKLNENDILILFISLDSVKVSDIKDLNRKLEILKSKLSAFILLGN